MNIDFEKYPDRLVPAIIQDAETRKVLMLGYMSSDSLALTEKTGKVTFFSRSRKEIWTKGETSGNFLTMKEILIDCDNDALLIKAVPGGPVCHTGSDTCFSEENVHDGVLSELEKVIAERRRTPYENSYTSSLFASGLNKITQKFGEEAVELVIEALGPEKELLLNESADLLYHFLVLLAAKDVSLGEVLEVLKKRRNDG
ncbi:MAG: bifunctional phosphoribosyl-AMP cyclohydrolase/phosphoribosyl-ATP diphosphatase HisIE [Pyrinomonadaceae bacterium]